MTPTDLLIKVTCQFYWKWRKNFHKCSQDQYPCNKLKLILYKYISGKVTYTIHVKYSCHRKTAIKFLALLPILVRVTSVATVMQRVQTSA
jgi:hypothetical protein